MEVEAGSFRDPSGYIYKHDGLYYRAILEEYREQYDYFIRSGLYDALCKEKLLIGHHEHEIHDGLPGSIYKVILPDQVPFISYPYEWPFYTLKKAALLTLRIARIALQHKMVLKDASAFNIQLLRGKPIFIDTLSFEKYQKGQAWLAYGQFCRHFVAPLALFAYGVEHVNKIMVNFIDGIPLDLTSRMLPFKSKFNLGLYAHIHLHAKTIKRSYKDIKAVKVKISRSKLEGILKHLDQYIDGLKLKRSNNIWNKYYGSLSYSDDSFEHKQKIIRNWLADIKPSTTCDLGCNTGVFSELAADYSNLVLSVDSAHDAVNELAKRQNHKILPLVIDLTSPSPSVGWANQERKSWHKRATTDLVLALALLHHISIANNVPFKKVALLLARSCSWLVIEFIPKDDKMIKELLINRKDVFHQYTLQDFKSAFEKYFDILEEVKIEGSGRSLFLMKKSE